MLFILYKIKSCCKLSTFFPLPIFCSVVCTWHQSLISTATRPEGPGWASHWCHVCVLVVTSVGRVCCVSRFATRLSFLTPWNICSTTAEWRVCVCVYRSNLNTNRNQVAAALNEIWQSGSIEVIASGSLALTACSTSGSGIPVVLFLSTRGSHSVMVTPHKPKVRWRFESQKTFVRCAVAV